MADSWKSLVSKFEANVLELELGAIKREADTELQKFKTQLGANATKLQGKRPATLKATMTYILAQSRGLRFTQVAESFGITTVSLAKTLKLFKQLLQSQATK